MLLALDLLLVGELATARDRRVLRLQRCRIGTGWLRCRDRRSGAGNGPGACNALRGLGDLDDGDEALEIALLLGLEVAGRQIGCWLEVGLARSAGAWLGAAGGAGAGARGGGGM